VYTKRVNMKGEGVGEKKKTSSVNAEQTTSTAENVKERVVDAAAGVKDKVSEVLGGGK
jgi:MinD superfamily P-loop ATPase